MSEGHALVTGSGNVAAPYHDAAGAKRRLASWRPANTRANEVAGLELLRARARHVYANNAIARGLVDFLVCNIVGNGISPQPLVSNKRTRERIITLWEQWGEQADFADTLDVYGLQTLAVRTWLTSGEAFVVHRPYETDSGVGYQVQVLEPDFVPLFDGVHPDNSHSICQGIEFDQQGKIVAYWVLKSEARPANIASSAWLDRYERIDARHVSHLYEPLRPGQLRGIPPLSVSLVRLRNTDDLDDAVLERQRIANLFVAFITRPAGEIEDYAPPTGEAVDVDEAVADAQAEETLPPIQLEPGASQVLEDGEDIKFSEPPDAGTNYVDYMRWQYRTICAAYGIPYAVAFNDYADANDRTMRVALNEFARRITQITENIVVHQLCRPMRRKFFDAAILAGLLPSNKAEIRNTRWVPQAKPYIHPVQDMQALKMKYELGMTSRTEMALQQGKDADLLDSEIARDNARERKLGLKFHEAIATNSAGDSDSAGGADTANDSGD